MAGILLIYILGIYFLLTKMVQLEDEAVVGVKKTHKELSETTHSSNEKAIQYVASNMIKEAPKIAITFDDGPSPAWTPKLLDGLKERNVKATFFLIGERRFTVMLLPSSILLVSTYAGLGSHAAFWILHLHNTRG